MGNIRITSPTAADNGYLYYSTTPTHIFSLTRTSNDTRLSAYGGFRVVTGATTGPTAGTLRMIALSGGNVGIGNNTSPATLLHLYRGDAGAVTPSAQTGLTIEDDSDIYIEFLTPKANTAGIVWGNPTDGSTHAYITYDNNASKFLVTLGSEGLELDNSGNLYPISNGNLGGSATLNRWSTVYTSTIRTYSSGQAPADQAALLTRGQQNLIVARCRMLAGSTPSIVGDHWNVASVSRTSEGIFRINFDQTVDEHSSIVATMEYTGGSPEGVLYVCKALMNAAGTHCFIYTYRIGQGSTTGTINTTGGAAYVSLDDLSSSVYIHVAVIGRPGTLQT